MFPSPWTPATAADADRPTRRQILREYGRVLVQRRWAIVGSVVAVASLVGLWTVFTTPIFRASTTLQIDRQGPDILTFRDVMGVDPAFASYQDFYQTQYRILQSRSVVTLAVERLDLVHRPEWVQRADAPLVRLRHWVTGVVTGREPASDPRERAARFIETSLSVGPVRNSQLVRVAFEDPSATLARDVANAMAEAYLEFNYRSRYGTTALAAEFLTREVARVQGEIAQLERDLQARRVERELLASDEAVSDISKQALTTLNGHHAEARARHAEAEARWVALRDASPDEIAEVGTHPVVVALEQGLADLARQHAQMAERFKSDWPALVQLRSELDDQRARLAAERVNIAARVRGAAEAAWREARAEVGRLAEEVETQKREVRRVDSDTIELAGIRSSIETKRKILEDLVARQSETATSDRLRDTQASNVRIVDPARVPDRPVRPSRGLNLALACLVGLALGILAAFALDHLDDAIQSERDVQRIAELPVLGHLPLVERVGPDTAGGADLTSHADPRSPFAEACRNLRTSLLLASAEHPPHTVVVTSCEPSDGKSTVALNLAVVLTQMHRRVLLVDADLRRPRLHRAIAAGNEVGLSSYLSGNAADEELLRESPIAGLDVVTSGPIPPNPAELLDSPALTSFLALQHDRYDHVILDSPPLLQVTDAVLLASRADTTILVARQGKTRRESLLSGTRRLRQARAAIAGAVVNAVSSLGAYGYGAYRSYAYVQDDVAGRPAAARRRFRARRAAGG